MIKHDFIIEFGHPIFKMQEEFWMLEDLNDLHIESVKRTIENLEAVVRGETEIAKIEGHHITDVHCKQDGCKIYCVDEMGRKDDVPIEWFVELYKDWLKFLQDFENNKRSG